MQGMDIGMRADSSYRISLHAFYRRLTRARRVAEHPLNGRLFAEDLLIEYARLSRAH